MADAYEIKDNTFTLFRVVDKESDRHPDFTGKGMKDGKLVYVAAWMKESKSGKKYLSGSFSEPREKTAAAAPEKKPTSFADMKEDIPF